MSDPLSLELLQITLIVADLARAEADFARDLGLRVAFRDPSVATWGLENSVLPMGRSFFEILSPTRPDTPGGRHIARQGDGGYMVILQTRDLSRAPRARPRARRSDRPRGRRRAAAQTDRTGPGSIFIRRIPAA